MKLKQQPRAVLPQIFCGHVDVKVASVPSPTAILVCLIGTKIIPAAHEDLLVAMDRPDEMASCGCCARFGWTQALGAFPMMQSGQCCCQCSQKQIAGTELSFCAK